MERRGAAGVWIRIAFCVCFCPFSIPGNQRIKLLWGSVIKRCVVDLAQLTCYVLKWIFFPVQCINKIKWMLEKIFNLCYVIQIFRVHLHRKGCLGGKNTPMC